MSKIIITNLFIGIYPMWGFFPLGTFWIPDSTVTIKKYYFLIFHKNTLKSVFSIANVAPRRPAMRDSLPPSSDFGGQAGLTKI